jgi:hypothetical protein
VRLWVLAAAEAGASLQVIAAMDLEVAPPPPASWSGIPWSAARGMEREAEAELLSITRLPQFLLSLLTAPPPLRPQAPSPAARSAQRRSTEAPTSKIKAGEQMQRVNCCFEEIPMASSSDSEEN